MPDDIYVSVMAQYFPAYKAKEDNLINNPNYQNQIAGILAVCASNYLDRLCQN